MDAGTVTRVCGTSKTATPTVVDDSETEDESDSEWIPMQPKPAVGADNNTVKKRPEPIIIIDSDSEDFDYAGAASEASSTRDATSSIVVDDSETEDESEEWIRSMQPKPAVVANNNPVTKSPKPMAIDDSSPNTGPISKLASTRYAISSISAQSTTIPGTRQETIQPAFLSDRAQMEAERLARRKRALGEDYELTGTSKRQRTIPPLASRTFYDGAFFPTYVAHANPRADGREAIRFEEVVGSTQSGLKLAIVSTFGDFNRAWVASHLDSSVPIIRVGGKKGRERRTGRHEDTNWIDTRPKLRERGCMHMKYMLLFYHDRRLRVVVSTANLIAQDWNDLENMVFIQDLDPLSASSRVLGSDTPSASVQVSDSFAAILENVLKETNVDPALKLAKQLYPTIPLKFISDLSTQWDWSRVKAQLVASIPGNYKGWNQIKAVGHPRLMQALDSLGVTLRKEQKLVIECQGSSIGEYTTQWFNQFYISASGNPSALKAHLELSKGKRQKLDYPVDVKVVYSTFQTVESADWVGSGSLFCSSEKWKAANFPKDSFYDSKSRAGKALMHTKMILATLKQKKAADTAPSGPAGWMYVGSHNFTRPAWGNLSGTRDAPVLNVDHFELGVVVPLMTTKDVNAASAWERPPKKYTERDVPWMKDLHKHLKASNA
ncbi:tyrosyl-DNA phosphodiesterase-domain-containing protein [Favolaschia claudopus]|uniref:Tyrosyl-DNA phosphodiesterase-domain-containing protein n=1 Tax=Favolaschia claudopus TaxID=2862362 RepID=A0AAW0BXY4_9AGAR